MKFGHFDDARREYVIETPATPLPWINYLGNEDFFGLISQTGGGYDFYRDAKLRRITRYRYNGVPADNGSRSFYISLMGKDGKPISTFSPTYLPSRTHLDRYCCRHGMGYTVFETQCHGISSTLTAFVPLHTNAEVDQLSVTNTTDHALTVDVTAAIEWCLWDAVDDSTNFQRNLSTGEVEIELPTSGCDEAAVKAATEQYGTVSSTIYHKTEFKERRNHYAFFSVNSPVIGFDTDRATFLGQFNGWDRPDAITSGKAFNSVAHGWSPIAAPRTRITLAPGQSHTFVYVLGYIEVPKDQKWEDPSDPAKVGIINKKPAHELIARFSSPEQVQQALDQLRDYWTKLLSVFQVSTGQQGVDRMANIWNQYQCMVTFNLSRSASYFESGIGRGMGFRDSNQDILGFVHMIPQRARQRILDLASTQLPDGSAWHQYQPLTKKGNAGIGGGFNDDPLWLVASTYAYLAETGDVSILKEPVVFNSEKGTEKPLLEHLRRSVNFTISHRGPHGLPLIGRADWNDCLNLNAYTDTPGESFQTVKSNKPENIAESVFIGGMFVLYAGRYVQILQQFGRDCGMSEKQVDDEMSSVRHSIASIRQAVETAGWDGQWFKRAYDANSNPVGSDACKEGKIFIEPQGMCVMAGIGLKDGKASQALASTKKLLTSDLGTAILWPAYSTYHIELGEISSYPRGYKENGGIFCHINPWISIANAVAGNDQEAFDGYWRICPSHVESYSEVHKTEPYIYCQMVAGPESFAPGEGKNSWLTGTAAWTFVDLSQYLLGIRPTLTGLGIDPHLPADQFPSVHVTRQYRGTTYHIHLIHDGQRYPNDEPELSVNGKTVPASCVSYEASGRMIPVIPIAAPGTASEEVEVHY